MNQLFRGGVVHANEADQLVRYEQWGFDVALYVLALEDGVFLRRNFADALQVGDDDGFMPFEIGQPAVYGMAIDPLQAASS